MPRSPARHLPPSPVPHGLAYEIGQLLERDLNKTLKTGNARVYNAGPGRIHQLRKLAAERGLDPNVWFDNVELITAKKVGRETVTYVSNIYKYYLAYQLLAEASTEREQDKEAAKEGK